MILYQQILSKWNVPKSTWEDGDCHQYKMQQNSLTNQLVTTDRQKAATKNVWFMVSTDLHSRIATKA